eukprot:5911653-Amphidinium_carterae.1
MAARDNNAVQLIGVRHRQLRDLYSKLLSFRTPRLVQAHPFFEGLDFTQLRQGSHPVERATCEHMFHEP